MKKRTKIVILLLVLVVGGWYLASSGKKTENYVTKKLVSGDISERITASGIINPVSTVNIGTQVSGTILKLFVDYNSPVSKGQMLAQIDPALFEAVVAQRKAALNVAKAQVEVIKNDITFAKKHLDRIKKLHESQYAADRDLEAAEREHANAVVQLELQKAQVNQAEAQLLTAEIDLKNTRIISPVDGIVISREIEVGQTVAASFQTPTLFMVAEDLTKMEIVASIVEADIAKVERGQIVEFNVDSFSDMTFHGVVMQVRNNPITVQNVVTYDVIIGIDNKDNILKPGMTANVTIITAEKRGILLAPNEALRFYIAEADGTIKRYRDRGVWILEGGKPKRVSVTTGASDDKNTEVISKDLKEGMKLIVESTSVKPNKGGRGGSMGMRMPR